MMFQPPPNTPDRPLGENVAVEGSALHGFARLLGAVRVGAALPPAITCPVTSASLDSRLRTKSARHALACSSESWTPWPNDMWNIDARAMETEAARSGHISMTLLSRGLRYRSTTNGRAYWIRNFRSYGLKSESSLSGKRRASRFEAGRGRSRGDGCLRGALSPARGRRAPRRRRPPSATGKRLLISRRDVFARAIEALRRCGNRTGSGIGCVAIAGTAAIDHAGCPPAALDDDGTPELADRCRARRAGGATASLVQRVRG